MLRAGDELNLTALVRSPSLKAGLAQRARIVLLAAEGCRTEIARRVGVPADGDRLEERYDAEAWTALDDRPSRAGRR